jgi:transcriptional regulator with XRE-family HTH domain
MENEMRHIGERIDAIIKKAGISRARLGEILGVKEGAIGRHIRGETDPGALALFKIAQIGGVTIDWLITGKNNGNQNEGKTIEEAIVTAFKSNPEVAKRIGRELIGEEEDRYIPHNQVYKGLSQDEQELIEAYRQADHKIRKHAKRMLEEDAQESRRNDGGGSNSAEGNCA